MAFDPERRRILGALLGLPVLGRLAVAGEKPATGAATSRPATSARAVVARCRREGLLGEKGTLVPEKLDEVLGASLTRAVGEDSPVDVMRRLFRPSDVVGLKINALAGRRMSPHPLLVERLCDWLQKAGVPARNIVIWDRSDRELAAAGFRIARSGSGVRCLGTNNDYDWTPGDPASHGSSWRISRR
jgi:hypothetical protein